MKTINNFIVEKLALNNSFMANERLTLNNSFMINERLTLNKQSKNIKQFKDLTTGDIIYKMHLHDNVFSDIYSCTIININHEHYEDVIVDYTCKNDRSYATFSISSFYSEGNYVIIDSIHTDIYYFINKDDAKKVQTSHISNSIKKLQNELSKLKDINHPNYRKNVEDREWQIELIEKELNELIEQSKKYNNDQ